MSETVEIHTMGKPCCHCQRLWIVSLMLLFGSYGVIVRAWLQHHGLLLHHAARRTPRQISSCQRISSSSETWTAVHNHTTKTVPGVENDESSFKVPRNFRPYPFDYWQELNVTVEAMTNRGLGIARVEVPPRDDEENARSSERVTNGNKEKDPPAGTTTTDKKKWVIMIPNVIPGERVRVRVFRNFPNYSEADLIQVLQASENRVEPLCSLAMTCGGCQFQHMSVPAQRAFKAQMVKEALEQYGIIAITSANDKENGVKVSPCLGTEETFAYRSKLTPHYEQPTSSRRGQSNTDNINDHGIEKANKHITAIGFQKQSTRQIVDVPSCPIATPAVNQAYQHVREQLLLLPPKSKKGATLLFRQANLNDKRIETNHKNFITTTVRGLNFTYRAGNFFQNNYYVLPLMVEHVVAQATSKPKLSNHRNDHESGMMTHLADCYCGSGLFALSAAQHFERVVGIEINDVAISEATANAASNHITNCEFKAASAEAIFNVIQDFPRHQTVVVLDPPRKGCSVDFLQQLYEFAPQRIVYMSCDPTTQARDAAGIVQAGYEITSVQPFDLFPQTRHIECLMVFERHSNRVG